MSLRLRESDHHPPLLRALDIALVVTSDPIPHRHEVEASLVEHVVELGGKLKQSLREAVVEVLLLGRVVQRRVPEVVGPVGYEVFLELGIVAPRELLAEHDRLGVDGPSPLSELVILGPHAYPGVGGGRYAGASSGVVVVVAVRGRRRTLRLVAHGVRDVVVSLRSTSRRGGGRVIVRLVRVHMRARRGGRRTVWIVGVGGRLLGGGPRGRVGMVPSALGRRRMVRPVPLRRSRRTLLVVIVPLRAAGRGGLRRAGRGAPCLGRVLRSRAIAAATMRRGRLSRRGALVRADGIVRWDIVVPRTVRPGDGTVSRVGGVSRRRRHRGGGAVRRGDRGRTAVCRPLGGHGRLVPVLAGHHVGRVAARAPARRGQGMVRRRHRGPFGVGPHGLRGDCATRVLAAVVMLGRVVRSPSVGTRALTPAPRSDRTWCRTRSLGALLLLLLLLPGVVRPRIVRIGGGGGGPRRTLGVGPVRGAVGVSGGVRRMSGIASAGIAAAPGMRHRRHGPSRVGVGIPGIRSRRVRSWRVRRSRRRVRSPGMLRVGGVQLRGPLPLFVLDPDPGLGIPHVGTVGSGAGGGNRFLGVVVVVVVLPPLVGKGSLRLGHQSIGLDRLQLDGVGIHVRPQGSGSVR
mmetsp:Transcript_32648/g.79061  ORF Transcript_32648/g.79061 Transcript_32648/m.79061 type:complete len:627 (+) Transcript_32648:256-2136(+)